MKLSGHTKPFAVLGHPIGHTLSPVMHNASMQELGFDGIYLALDVHPDQLMDVLPSMAKMGFAGVNLTVPHKEIAFRGLDTLGHPGQAIDAFAEVRRLDRHQDAHLRRDLDHRDRLHNARATVSNSASSSAAVSEHCSVSSSTPAVA